MLLLLRIIEEEKEEELEGKLEGIVGSATDTFYIIILDVVFIIIDFVRITDLFNG